MTIPDYDELELERLFEDEEEPRPLSIWTVLIILLLVFAILLPILLPLLNYLDPPIFRPTPTPGNLVHRSLSDWFQLLAT